MKSIVTAGYSAFVLSENSRTELLLRFPPKYPEVIAHHVTYRFATKSTDPLPPPVRNAVVVGYKDSGNGLEALVVEVNGTTERVDGQVYHTTLSLDRKTGSKPFHSNKLLSTPYESVERFSITLTPAFIDSK